MENDNTASFFYKGISSTDRTTNTYDFFCVHFKNYFCCLHPDIFRLIMILTDLQMDTYIKLYRVLFNRFNFVKYITTTANVNV